VGKARSFHYCAADGVGETKEVLWNARHLI
jgi:hypothetical protein